ncbi:MAG: hypothetical protein NXH70_00735 [Hyphomonas sp.]|nr:hypothetical protein [Hyphomonas sp.]
MGVASRFSLHPASKVAFDSCLILSPLSDDSSNDDDIARVSVRSDCVIGNGEEVSVFTSSLIGETGLVPPEQFSSIWQNIRTVDERRAKSVSLKSIAQSQAGDANWIATDHLIPIQQLLTLEEHIDRVDVVICRLVSDPDIIEEATRLDDKKTEKWLKQKGFKSIGSIPDRLPVLAHRIWVRDLRLVLKKERDNTEQTLKAHEAAIDQINASKANQADELERLTTAFAIEHQKSATIIEDLERRDAERSELVSSLQQKSQQQSSEQEHQNQRISDLQSKIDSHSSTIRDQRESERRKLDETQRNHDNQLDELRNNHKVALRTLEQELKTARQESKLHRNNLDDIRKKYAELLKDHDAQSRSLAEIELHLTAVCDEMGLLENVEQS